jgi:crossover junction endodeoxyribonuclease RuvC
MSTVFVGIDPGSNGAIAAIIDGVPKVWGINKETINADILEALMFIYEIPGVKVVCMEKVAAMPRQGVVSMFTFGKAVGLLTGMCVAFRMGVQIEPTPQTWKKVIFQNTHKGLPRERQKQLAREKACLLYPSLHGVLKFKKDADKAEAVLLAHYAMMKERS